MKHLQNILSPKNYSRLLSCILILLFYNSIYCQEIEKKRINKSILIETPCSEIFHYLGNSDNARIWSVFVAFIEAKNPEEFPDGAVGSQRVCYTKTDKSGFNWEEEILEVRKNNYRQLSCYNFENLFIPSSDLVTEQIYEEQENGCNLTFTLDYKNDPSGFDKFKFWLATPKIKRIFKQNLSNIRTDILSK